MSNRIISIFLAVGAIMLLALFAILWPSGQTEAGTEAARLLAENKLTSVYLFIGGASFTMMQTGSFLITEKLIKKTDSTYRQLLVISKLAFASSLAIFIGSGSLFHSSMKLYSAGDASTAGLVNIMATSLTDLLPWIWGVGMIILGIAAVTGPLSPKKTLEWARAAFIIPGILFVIGPFLGNSNFAFGSWIINTVVFVVIGILLETKKIDF